MTASSINLPDSTTSPVTPADGVIIYSDNGFLSYLTNVGSPIKIGNVLSVATAGLATGGIISTNGTVTVTAAAQSDMETASSTTTAVTPSVFKYHPGINKAWVQFTVTGGTITINASYNVTSVTRNGAGDYTVNFTVSFSSANYGFSVTAGQGSAGTGAFIVNAPAGANPTTSAFRFTTFLITLLGLGDANFVSANFYGDQ